MRSPESFPRIRLDGVIESLPPDSCGTVVYVGWTTQAQDEVKIGRTFRGADIRAHELALGNRHFKVWATMPGSPLLERRLKSRFQFISLDNREIFSADDRFVTYIKRLVKIRKGMR